MNKEYLMTVLRAPHFSEKSSQGAEKKRQYVFKVLPSSSKEEIKQAVKLMFKVDVLHIRTVKMEGKLKRKGRLNAYKKAYVTLSQGHEIDFSGEAPKAS